MLLVVENLHFLKELNRSALFLQDIFVGVITNAKIIKIFTHKKEFFLQFLSTPTSKKNL
jgi:hypothetical protein